MSQRNGLTVAQRESIYRDKQGGLTINALAQKYHCSPSCVRHWWRVGRDHGIDGLHPSRGMRPGTGALSTFAPVVAEQVLQLKQLHPKRGATRILHDLTNVPQTTGCTLPKRSSLAEFFHQRCPELLHSYHHQPAPPPPARHVHELWQMDSKEGVNLQDQTIATVLDIREPIACIFLGSFAHAVQTEKHWRKLTLHETQDDLRAVFTEFGLPVGVQTDRENLYGRPASEAFPTSFTLWLVGLGIQHHFSRPNQPTDQPQVERGHRTLFDWMAQPDPIANLVTLQADLDTARYKHNAILPSQAGNCQGGIPLQVHPEVLHVQRPYHAAAELSLFSLAHVDHFLSQFSWQYKVSTVGQISIHDYPYHIGMSHAGKVIDVRFDPRIREFIFSDAQTIQEVKRHPARGLDVSTITGLDMPILVEHQPIQLSFAF